MKESRVVFECLITVAIVVALSCSKVMSATPANWSEVTRFLGSGSDEYTTTYFTCGHAEWRIRWAYVPHPDYPQYSGLSVITYPKGETYPYGSSVDSISKQGGSDTSGISYIHNRQGTFYCKIGAANTQNYTIVIEEDLDSIPEFSSFIIPFLFTMAALPVIIICKKKRARSTR